MMKRDEPEVVNSRWEEDSVILGAVLDIQSAIQRIARIYEFSQNEELGAAIAELKQAVNWLKGKE